MSDPRTPSIGSVLAGRYRLVRVIGEGAMGAVFEAVRLGDQKVLAVKTMFRDLSAATGGGPMLARFLREAQVSRSLSHPNVVPVVDGGIDEATQTAFLVMELLVGEDLSELIARVGPLSSRTAIKITLQACAGLAVAHAQGIVHRDIKPSNLFLHRSGQSVLVKLCDFGVAKAALGGEAGTDLTRTGSMLGSPIYMSPEQLFAAKQVDGRADVWGLGMVLYEMLTGSPALIRCQDLAELVQVLGRGAIPQVQESAPWVPPSLATLLHGTLVKDPAARCPSVEALAHALGAFVVDDRLTEADLVGVEAHERNAQTQRAPVVTAWQGSTDSSAPREDPLIGQVIAGKYRLLRLLGQGGMGAVYEADTREGLHVAIKVILPERAANASNTAAQHEAMRRFVREARTMMSVDSPHVVKVLAADRDPQLDMPYLVMELMNGTDLDKLVRQSGALEPHAVAKLFEQAAMGLHAAHCVGVVHRDIKPANLFLHETASGEVVVKVCDFGVAKQSFLDETQGSHDLTRTGGILGSPMYVSPEQAKSAKHVDHRADIWSLCISMHEALTGKRPWQNADSLAELILAICTTLPTSVQDVSPWVPADLAKAVHQGLQREPSDRYASAEELAKALHPFAAKCAKLSRRSLLDLTPEARATVAARAAVPQVRGPGHALAQTLAAEPAKKSSVGLVLGAVAVVAAAGAATAFALRRPPPAPPPEPVAATAPVVASSAPAAPVSAVAPTPVLVKGTLTIKPPGAEVTVNGKKHEADAEGRVVLEGEPGESFDIVATKGGSVMTKVTLSRDGSLNPPSLVVPAAGVAKPKPAGAAGAPGAATTTTAKPPGPIGPKPRDDF